jgi:6-pyruvoyltetrahydropterin/6-carboxytetrahydropterin synthase
MFADYVTTTFNADLNDVLDVQPTSERIAEHLAVWFTAHVQPHVADTLRSVWVSETPATWASYTPSGGVS